MAVAIGIASELKRIAVALEKIAGRQAGNDAGAGGACEKCGSTLERFTAKDGTKYQRCAKGQQLYRKGAPEEGHHFSKIGE